MKPSGFNAKQIHEHYIFVGLRNTVLQSTEAFKRQRLGKGVDMLNKNERLGSGGKYMRIKFEKYEVVDQPGKGGKVYKMCAVTGKQIGGKQDGDSVTKKFFCSNKDMYSTTKTFSKGDIVEIDMKQNGNFWNPVGIRKIDDDVNDTDQKVSKDAAAKSTTPYNSLLSPEEALRKDYLAMAIRLAEVLPKPTALEDIMQTANVIAAYVKNGYDEGDSDIPDDDMPDTDGLDDD